MGWTEKEATYYKKNGNIDVKKEVEALLTGGKDVSRVLAIRNVGSVYYVAVKSYKEYVPGRERDLGGYSGRKTPGMVRGHPDKYTRPGMVRLQGYGRNGRTGGGQLPGKHSDSADPDG